MTWDETFDMLSADWKATAPNPARMRELLTCLGNPEKELHFIHIAGTNGKGSASAMLSSILTGSGYRTGRYISPHLAAINERWSIDGTDITDEKLSDLLNEMQPVILSMKETPTKFEILTALGLLYFAREHCQTVVLEVGLGGRLDATNAIPVPDCAVIMNIGLEHTEILGDTLEKIAFEKGGIIKSDGDVVLYRQCDAVCGVIAELCQERGARLHVTETDRTALHGLAANECQCFDYKDREDLRLSLLGQYQVWNACAVLDAVDILIAKGYRIPESAIRLGLQNTRWPGRFEILQTDPLWIVDGAHNPNGVEALMASVGNYLSDYHIIFLMGVMADKDYDEMIRLAAPYASHFIAQMPGEEKDRALEEQALAARIRTQFHGPVETAGSVAEGVSLALKAAVNLETQTAPGAPAVVCFGSLYQVSEIREALKEPQKP